MRPTHILSGLAAAAAAGAIAVPALAASRTSTLKSYKFSPSSLTVKKGTTVTWKFDDAVVHNVAVKSGPVKFRSANLAKGKTYSHRFTTAGVYHLICTIHPYMKQTVRVR